MLNSVTFKQPYPSKPFLMVVYEHIYHTEVLFEIQKTATFSASPVFSRFVVIYRPEAEIWKFYICVDSQDAVNLQQYVDTSMWTQQCGLTRWTQQRTQIAHYGATIKASFATTATLAGQGCWETSGRNGGKSMSSSSSPSSCLSLSMSLLAVLSGTLKLRISFASTSKVGLSQVFWHFDH